MLTKQQILEVEQTNGSRNLELRREFNKQMINAGAKKKKARKKKNKPKPIKKKKRKLSPYNKFVKHVLSHPDRYNLIPTESGKYRIKENASKISDLWKRKQYGDLDARESNTMKEIPDEFDDPNEYLSDDGEMQELAADIDNILDWDMEAENRMKKGKSQQQRDRIRFQLQREKKKIQQKARRERERELLKWQKRDNKKFDERRAREFEKQLRITRG